LTLDLYLKIEWKTTSITCQGMFPEYPRANPSELIAAEGPAKNG
jgi:hypothetical protein